MGNHRALKWMSVQLEMNSSCPSRLDASLTSDGLSSLGPFQMDSFGLSIYVEWLSALQRAPKEKQNREWRGQAALLSVFPGSIWKRREVWESAHPGTKFSLSRMPGFLSVLWIYPHQTCFQFLIHVVTQCDGLFPHPSRNLSLRIHGCPSIPLKSPVIHEASKRQNRGGGAGSIASSFPWASEWGDSCAYSRHHKAFHFIIVTSDNYWVLTVYQVRL